MVGRWSALARFIVKHWLTRDKELPSSGQLARESLQQGQKMAAYHESRVKALSEYSALRYPNTPRLIHMGRSSDVGWQSDTIDSVEGVEGQVIDSGGHFARQIPHVNLLPSAR